VTFALSALSAGFCRQCPPQAEVAPGAAKALGFTIPAGVLSIADEVIESMTNVRYWPKADIPSCTAHVRFRGLIRFGSKMPVLLGFLNFDFDLPIPLPSHVVRDALRVGLRGAPYQLSAPLHLKARTT